MTQAANHSDSLGTEQPVVDSALPPFPSSAAEAAAPVATALPVDHFGTSVFVKAWHFAQTERPPIVLVHDVGEHSDCYQQTALAFVEAGYPVYVYDWRGHGRSGRQLGHAPSFQVLVKDLLQVAAWARSKEAGQPPVVIGQGLGALVVMEFTKRFGHFCRGAVLSAPCLEMLAEVSWARRFLLKLMADMAPQLRVRGPLTPRFTKDRVLMHPTLTGEEPQLEVRFPGLTSTLTHELASAVKRAEARFIEFPGSVLILCPERDGVCTYQNLKKSAAIHADHNLDIVDLPNTSHNVFTGDPSAREAAIHIILNWLAKQLVLPREDAAQALLARDSAEANPSSTS